MTSLRTGPRQPGPSFKPLRTDDDVLGDQPAAVPSLRRRRNLPGASLGVLLVSVCAFGIAAWANSVGHRSQVLVVTQNVPAGSVIQANDLTTAGVAADHQVSAIAAAAESQEVGKVARVDLLPGSLLEASDVGIGPAIPAGTSIVGMDLKSGSFPTELRSGTTVEVISTPSAASASGGGTVLAQTATVLSVSSDQNGPGSLVSLAVPAGEASAVASAGAAGDVSLVMLSGTGS